MITYPTNELQKVLLAGKCRQGVLPDGYTQVEYLESSGTQYIDTGINGSNLITAEIKAVFQYTDNSKLFGYRINTTTSRNVILASSGGYYLDYGTGKQVSSDVNVNSNIHIFKLDKNKAYIDGVLTNTYTEQTFTGGSIYLFACNQNGEVNGATIAKVYYAKILNNDTLVRNLIPAKRNSDNVVGMYDTISKTFFTNAGTGTFIAGADVVPTPDNPIDIVCNNGVIKVNRNLYSTEYHDKNLSQSDGITTSTNAGVNVSAMVDCTNVKSFMVTSTTPKGYCRIFKYRPDGTFINSSTTSTIGQVLEIPSDCGYFRIQYNYSVGTDTENILIYDNVYNLNEIYTDGIQEVVTDNLGNTATAKMLLAVGDYIDKQSVLNGVVTRNVGVKVFDGTENFGGGQASDVQCVQITKAALGISSDTLPVNSLDLICTHYKAVNGSDWAQSKPNTIKVGNGYLFFNTQYIQDSDSFKAYLADQYAAGTPVIIVYPLATPITEQVTPQPLAGNSVTQTAGSIDNLPIVTDNITKLKSRYITDRNGVPHEVVAVYVGNNLVYFKIEEANAEFYKRKTGGTQSVGSGIAAIKEVRGKSIVWNQLLKEGKLVDMGLPSGTLWASCNIDITQEDGFAASPFQYECSFFSWGNVDGHNPISTSTFDYDWGGVNQAEPWYEGQPYGETDGNTLTGNIPVGEAFDAARKNLGATWRMPTSVEFQELFNNSKFIDANGDEIDSSVSNKLVTVNEVTGIYLESKLNGARLFFSCSGNGKGSLLGMRGTGGNYWSATWISARNAKYLGFASGGVYPQSSYLSRNYGFALRPVLTHKLTPETGGNGHKFIQYGDNIADLTLMYGTGNEPASVDDFVKLYPLNRYTYNKGEVIPFAGQNLTTTGKNQYNPATGKANLLGGQTYQLLGTYTGATIDGVAVTLDSNNCFTTTKDCVLDVAGGNDTDTIVALYNGENVTFEPYERHSLPLDPSQWRDKQGNLVFPYGGMHGVGGAYDYAKVDADGYIRKAVRCFSQVNLGNLQWLWSPGYRYFIAYISGLKKYNGNIKPSFASTIPYDWKPQGTSTNKSWFQISGDNALGIIDSSFSQDSAGAAQLKSSLSGKYHVYELATPVEVELATPVYAKYLVDKDGTEEITPANGTAPYTTMANLHLVYSGK